MLLESNNSSDKISKIVDIIMSSISNNNTKFEKRIDDTLIWCNDDSDMTIFIQEDDGGYAAIDKNDVMILSEDDVYESVQYQLEQTRD